MGVLPAASDATGRVRQAARRAVRYAGHAGHAALDLVYPPRCPVTDEAVTAHGTFAAAAWARASLLAPPWCAGCGLPFAPTDAVAALCVPCASPARFRSALTGPGRLDGFRAALRYDDASAPMILSLKYGDRHDLVPGLARLLARAADEVLAAGAVIVPVPLHRARLRTRRYNQAALLAQALGGQTGHAVAPLALRRTKRTPPQKGLSPAGRRRNVAGAFAARGPAPDRVLLVDDVATSGATLLGCAGAMRRAGAQEVAAVALARVIHAQA